VSGWTQAWQSLTSTLGLSFDGDHLLRIPFLRNANRGEAKMIYHAQCACGAVKIEAEGEPVIQCYCHCNRCRSFTGAPVNAVALWPRAAVRVVEGADAVRPSRTAQGSEGGRTFCGQCGGALGCDLLAIGMVDIFAGLVPALEFAPTMHLNYENAVLRIADGLPKLRDMPERSGGSGEVLPE